ncbi:MAG: hypothetical protein K1X75_15510 [Leptospirales bacterium]|nr:hypothetical protein [Leptospirales bacterium]
MKILRQPGIGGDLICTIAIGQKYFDAWRLYASPAWLEYCERYDLGLIAFDEDLIPRDHPRWKKATWQKMLIGHRLLEANLGGGNVCYLDTDILINPFAPNIFDFTKPGQIGLVSIRSGLPFPLHLVQRRLAFLRHTHYSSSYPLDSALFMSLEQLYGYHKLPPQEDEACMGLILFNPGFHAECMENWFMQYDRNVQSVTGGGDQTHINFEIQSAGPVNWLDYRFQAIWVYEMAWNYPFLYSSGREDNRLIIQCIQAALQSNYFLHFAGSWHESDMWKIKRAFEDSSEYGELRNFHDYLQQPVTGLAQGIIRPEQTSSPDKS